MKILLCAATPMEMFHSAFPGSEVDRVITGIGIAHTAFTLGAFLANTSVDLCLQIGIAGTFNPDLEIGSVVAVQKDCFADLGVEDHDRFVHITEALALDTQNAFDRLWIQPEDQLISQLDLPVVTAITVNTKSGLYLTWSNLEINQIGISRWLYTDCIRKSKEYCPNCTWIDHFAVSLSGLNLKFAP